MNGWTWLEKCSWIDKRERKDELIWSMNKDVFSVNSMYKDLMETDTLPDFCTSWKPKLPLKIIVFLWYFKKKE